MQSIHLFARLILCTTFYAMSANATVLSAKGYGETQAEAENAAKASLANSIFVRVESNVQSYSDNRGNQHDTVSINTSSVMPLINTVSNCEKLRKQYFCEVSLDAAKSLNVYYQEIHRIADSIDQRLTTYRSSEVDTPYLFLSEMVSDYEKLEKLHVIALSLGGSNDKLNSPKESKSAIVAKLVALEKDVNSLSLAAQLLSRNTPKEGIYLKPLTPADSQEVTPFSKLLMDQVRAQIPTVRDQKHAKYLMLGDYIQHEKGIQASYSVVDRDGNNLVTNVVNLTPESYNGIRVSPIDHEADQMLHKGYTVNEQFSAQLTTNKGDRQLLFVAGEKVTLFVKLNHAGTFFLVGHTRNQDFEHSYLIDVNEGGSGKQQFVRHVSDNEANHWISLGTFDVAPPFGVESMQLVASNGDLINYLPSFRFDPDSDYFVVAKDVKQGINKVRTTIKKMPNSKDKQVSESVLLFSTSN